MMEDEPSLSPEHEAALERLRLLVADCLDKHLLRSAIFWADKLVSLSDGEAADVFLLAQAYVYNGEAPRALALLRAEDLASASPRFLHLTATCLVATKAWDEALALLGEDVVESQGSGERAGQEVGASVSVAAACCLLRGRVYAALENRPAAARCFKARELAALPRCSSLACSRSPRLRSPTTPSATRRSRRC